MNNMKYLPKLCYLRVVLFCVFLLVTLSGRSQTTTFMKQLTVSLTNNPELTDAANLPLTKGGMYRVKLSVVSTGTGTGAEYLVWYSATTANWNLRMVSAAGQTSNHPTLKVENDTVKVSTQHKSDYRVRAFVEYFATENQYTRPFVFGSSFHWQRFSNDLYYMDGNVGIGTSTPQAKLAVDGNILAKEIKVKTDISVPDYVFEPDYPLSKLSDVARYVKEHKHLPEIPSSATITESGLDLAEMNLLLLKKVEELTLHLIEKEQQLESVLKRVEKLESKQ